MSPHEEMNDAIRGTLQERRLTLASERARGAAGREEAPRANPFGESGPAAVATDNEGAPLPMNDALRGARDDPRGRSMNEIIRGESAPPGEAR